MLQKALQNNGYPRRLVVMNWHPPLCSQLPEQDAPTATVTLPYIRHLSKTIQRILAPLRIRTCFRPHRTLRHSLVKLKNHMPLQQRAGVFTKSLVVHIPKCTYVNWTNGQDSGTLLEGAQEGIDIREPSPVSGSRACS